MVRCIVICGEERTSRGTHLPAIIFALRIIIASPSKGVSVMALGVGALTISALQAFNASRRAVWAFNKSSNLCGINRSR